MYEMNQLLLIFVYQLTFSVITDKCYSLNIIKRFSNYEVNCPSPMVKDHINLNWKPKLPIYKEGDRINWECFLGYNLVGNRWSVCLNNSTFSQRPQCIPVNCSPPSKPNLQFTPRKSVYEMKEIINMSCNEGYNLTNGSERAACGPKGEFFGVPDCKLSYCVLPRNLTKYLTVINKRRLYNFGETIQFECHSGYELNGGSQSICLTNGTFSNIPKCIPPYYWWKFIITTAYNKPIIRPAALMENSDKVSQCSAPKNLPNNLIVTKNEKQTYAIGEVIEFGCRFGYSIIAGQSRYANCSKTGRFDNIPRCAANNVGRQDAVDMFQLEMRKKLNVILGICIAVLILVFVIIVTIIKLLTLQNRKKYQSIKKTNQLKMNRKKNFDCA